METERDLNAIQLATAETERARKLHDYSIETSSDDRRLRILVEEVGEVARALEDRETSPDSAAALSAHLRSELVQVASSALRWVAMIAAEDFPDRKLVKMKFLSKRRPGTNTADFWVGCSLTGLHIDEAVIACTRNDLADPEFTCWMRDLVSHCDLNCKITLDVS